MIAHGGESSILQEKRSLSNFPGQGSRKRAVEGRASGGERGRDRPKKSEEGKGPGYLCRGKRKGSPDRDRLMENHSMSEKEGL